MTRTQAWMAAGAAAVVIVVVVALNARGDVPQYFGAAVEKGDIRDAVELTGTVNAVVTVQVGSQVSGAIAKLNADFNTRVHRGDTIAVIDPSLFEGALLQASADLESAHANERAAEANLAKARAMAEQARRDLDRYASLAQAKVATQQDFEQQRANEAMARAGVDAAIAAVAQAKADVSQKTAAVSIARTNLDHTIIRSPIDGIVVARNVDVGQTVAASLQAPTIFTIAQDLTKMQLYAKTQESDVGRIRVGQPATFKVDAFPRETFTGVVSQVRMNPTTIQNVVTYDALIDFKNPDLKLFPGMTAYATIPIATVEGVVKVPNGALRYKPPLAADVIRGMFARAGIANPDADTTRGAARDAARDVAVAWKLDAAGRIEPVLLTLGLTDHAFTEVRKVAGGTLVPGDQVVTGSIVSKSQPPAGVRR